jgi:hypothetical protein
VLAKNGFAPFHEGRGGLDLWGSANALLVEADLVQVVPEPLYQLSFGYCTEWYWGRGVVPEAVLLILRSWFWNDSNRYVTPGLDEPGGLRNASAHEEAETSYALLERRRAGAESLWQDRN